VLDVETMTRGADVVHVSQRFRLHGTAGDSITITQTFRLVTTGDGPSGSSGRSVR
jgi:hypothetical protein